MNAQTAPTLHTPSRDDLRQRRAGVFQFALLKNKAFVSGLISAATRDQIQRDLDDGLHAIKQLEALL